MWMLTACALLWAIVGGLTDEVTDGTMLVQTFLIHRHGDRTPTEETISLSTDPDAVEAATAQYGFGQLTDVGKRRAYKLGQYIAERFSELLAPKYNSSEIYIRSTDSSRTKMTVLAAMAAVFPARADNWSRHVNWTPAPYTTVPVKYDYNMATMNCPTLMAQYYANMFTSPSSLAEYSDVMDILANVSGIALVESYPAFAYGFYDVYVSQESLGIPVSPEIADIMPRLKQAADVAIGVMLDDDVKLMAGVLLNEFFTYSSSIIAGDDTPSVRIYSAHDVNVYALMVAAKSLPNQGVPPYASCFFMELRQVVETGQFVVLLVFKPDPSEPEIYLQVEGCELLCDVDHFKILVSDNLLNETTWRTDCDFTDDLVIDESSVA